MEHAVDMRWTCGGTCGGTCAGTGGGISGGIGGGIGAPGNGSSVVCFRPT